MSNIPLRNVALDKIRESGSLTDSELFKKLTKAGFILAEDKYNKILLDLEIMGLVKVSWLSKDTRRIEIVEQQEEIDEVELQNKEMMEKDYEASFPGTDNN